MEKKPMKLPERRTKDDMRKSRKVGTRSQGEEVVTGPLCQQSQLYPPVSVVRLCLLAPLVGAAQAHKSEQSSPNSTACHPNQCGQRAFWKEGVVGSI